MKSNTVKLLTLIAMLLVSVSAFAGTGNFTISEDTTLQGKPLKAGDYKVKWSDDGSVVILQHNKEVMTAQAKIEQKSEGAERNTVVRKVSTDGSSRITELRFGGKKQVLLLEAENVAQKQ